MTITVNGAAPTSGQKADFRTTFDVLDTAHAGAGGAAHANAIASGAAGFMTGADKTKLDGIYPGIPQNSQSADYTLVFADANKHIYHPPTDSAARTWTIPANSSVAYPIGTTILFDNDAGAGPITIITSDTLVLVGG